VQRYLVNAFVENNEEAQRLVRNQLVPRLVQREPVALDFVNVKIITQSFAHALMFDALRFAWASQTPIYVVGAEPVVRSARGNVLSGRLNADWVSPDDPSLISWELIPHEHLVALLRLRRPGTLERLGALRHPL
jgi:hypothetical protein